MGQVFRFDERKVGLHPGSEAADRILQPKRPCRDPRPADEHFGRRHSLEVAGQHHREGEVPAGRAPRIEIGRYGDRHPGIDQPPRW